MALDALDRQWSPDPAGTLRSVLVVTDAWHPQVNGVVRTIEQLAAELHRLGIETQLLTPSGLRTVPLPGYPEIGLALTAAAPIVQRVEALRPDAIHIATEGPLGLIVRNYCVRKRIPFTSAYHTQFPEYLRARMPVPLKFGYGAVRWFHGPSRAVLVGTPHVERLLRDRGFDNVALWTKGVDTGLFAPSRRRALDYAGPIFLYVGRVAVEKNIEAFLKLDLPGTKLVVGSGPSLSSLQLRYPQAVFLGARHGEELAAFFASADVFVFPSRTDTFGLVLLEALASGTPVAAYPVTGPIDVVRSGQIGALDEDLRRAVLSAMSASREACRTYAMDYSWQNSSAQFLAAQVRIAW